MAFFDLMGYNDLCLPMGHCSGGVSEAIVCSSTRQV